MPERTEAVAFTGRAGEWFKIWIVNLLLTIVTFGIYSAWAKVRREQYFKRNTSIEGRAFDYHATGMQILIGRIIVVVGLVAFSILSMIPLVGLVAILALVFLFPWLAVRSLAFNARNTSWSNVRFDFRGTYGDALVTYILAPIGVALTLYTTAPLLTRRVHGFFVRGHSLGNRSFDFGQGAGGYYAAFGLALLWVIGAGVVLALTVGGSVAAMFATLDAGVEPDPATALAPVLALYAALFLGFFPAALLYQAMVRNLMYAGTELEGGHRFSSTVRPVRLLVIAVTNALAVAASLGLMLPWAQVRITRYLAENSFVHPEGDLDLIAGRIEADAGAIGDAYSDIEGIDLGGVGI
ncbi:DUF898 domain-containing protein [Jannaschia sp. Os4]|nr:DUF898 domain-containing protein [Jannaschia sp. Os4]